MALVSKSIPNLINGVSQQPAALRLESQEKYRKTVSRMWLMVLRNAHLQSF